MVLSLNPLFFTSCPEYESDSEHIDIDFVYEDTDTYQNEMAELYSYAEIIDFHKNFNAFHSPSCLYKPQWLQAPLLEKKGIIMTLLNQVEVVNVDSRTLAFRSLLYIAQGCWGEVQTKEEQQQVTITNVMLLYKLGAFTVFMDLLNIEIANSSVDELDEYRSPKDASNLRCILSFLYIMVETIRYEYERGIDEDYIEIGKDLIQEINSPCADGDLLVVKLLGMLTSFCSGYNIHYPVKKICLLLWKAVLFGLGGMNVLRNLKDEYRRKMNLLPIPEDTLEVSKRMKSTTPLNGSFEIIGHSFRKPYKTRSTKRNHLKQQLDSDRNTSIAMNTTQMYLDLNGGEDMESSSSSDDDTATLRGSDDDCQSQLSTSSEASSLSMDKDNFDSSNLANLYPRIPWTPKTREKDILNFLDISRKKFIGFSLGSDSKSVAGLPKPIQEGIEIFKRYEYISLADLQIKYENLLAKYPLSTKPEEVPVNPTETLYAHVLSNLSQHVATLLKILLAAAPTTRQKIDGINLSLEISNMQLPFTKDQSAKLEIDIARHKEIISKALTATLLLLLKHFKLNHVYQFEFVAQNLMLSNAVPIFLRYFNQSIVDYVETKNNLPIFEFPYNVIEDRNENCTHETTYNPEINERCYSWRNLFTCINIVRIINKLVKWKHARIMMLAVFKWTPLLKKALKVRHSTLQLYILKLLKMQIKFTGRQWRKSNMHTIGAIYAKVRHRLNDDWVHGSDIETRPWDFQSDEAILKEAIDRLNLRRYPEEYRKSNIDSMCCCLSSFNSENSLNQSYSAYSSSHHILLDRSKTMSEAIRMCSYMYDDIITSHNNRSKETSISDSSNDEDLPEYFKQNYEKWLEDEVFNNPKNWDAI